MKILDRYIIREVLMTLAGVLFISLVIMLVYHIIEVYEDILRNSPEFLYVVLYFINVLPFDLVQVLPACLAIAVLIAIGHMAQSSEILAMFSSGISPVRITIPLLALSFVVSGLMFYLNEAVVPDTQYRARYYEKAYIEGKGQKIETKNHEVYQKGRGKRFYSLRDYDARNKIMSRVTIIDINDSGSGFKWRLDADRGEYIGGPTRTLWRFYNAREWNLETNQFIHHSEPFDLELEERAEEFLGIERKPEEMNITQLWNLISLLDSTGEETRPYRSEWHMKISYPVGNIIIALFCCALAIRANFRTLMIGFATGLLLTIVFYGVTMFFRMLGQNLVLPPLLAAWMANLIFAAFGVQLLLKRA